MIQSGNRISVLRKAQNDYSAALATVDDARIASTHWEAETMEPMVIDIEGPVGDSPLEALQFLVVMTSINYRFWSRDADGTLSRYRHLGKTGARALWAAFEQAWRTSAAEFAERLHTNSFEALFGEMPDRKSRETILKEVLTANHLADVCGEIVEDVEARGNVRVSHAGLLAQTFPAAFADPYLKKAQLTMAMYAGYLRSTGKIIAFTNLTAMADYQVPRVLRSLGILQYSPELSLMVDTGQMLDPDSPEENAIRAATIIACEKIAAQLGGSAADVDNLLWQSQDLAGDAPFHLTETTWY